MVLASRTSPPALVRVTLGGGGGGGGAAPVGPFSRAPSPLPTPPEHSAPGGGSGGNSASLKTTTFLGMARGCSKRPWFRRRATGLTTLTSCTTCGGGGGGGGGGGATRSVAIMALGSASV